MIERDLAVRVKAAARAFPVVTVTGPRQSGKSTLCRALFPQHPYVSLEAADVRAFAAEDPRGFLAQFPKGAVLDEVQRCPGLPSYLQGVVDTNSKPGRWILTGSQNLQLLQSVSQSLAGRAAVLHLLPLSRREVRRFRRYPKTLDQVLFAGGYPRIFDRRLKPCEWLASYVATYIERDVRTIINVGDLATFQRFVQLCAGRTGQLLNMLSLASDCGISQPTAKAWLSVLETSFVAFLVPGYSGNVRKRLVKMPKLHFFDTGLLCWLLGIRDAGQLRAHPLRGPVFETWVVSEIAKHRANGGETAGMYYYRDKNGLEVDVLAQRAKTLCLAEAKAGQTATSEMLGSIRRVKELLAPLTPAEAFVVYGGDSKQKRTDVTVLPWDELDGETWL